MTSVRVGVDIGGTFTDFTLLGDDGIIRTWKEDSSRTDPVAVIVRGLETMAAQAGVEADELLASAEVFVHGSTIATNSLIERDGARVGLLCTGGFRDVVYLRDGYKPGRFDMSVQHPGVFVDRFLRLGVRERIDRTGRVLTELDVDGVRRVAARFAEAEVEAIAIAMLWSSVNDAHERQAEEILARELPGVPVIRSSEVLQEIGEWHRTSATVLSAYVLPSISAYLRELRVALEGRRLRRPPLIMQINGGCSSVEEIVRRPVFTLASGPAAAPAAARYYARSLGCEDIISVDMGGTSLDVCVVHEGRAIMAKSEVADQPIGVNAVEVLSVGAGGGSIAGVDAGGGLHVGPKSAGSHPGPACYGAGGTLPTVTDANVVLGYIDPAAFLGGRRELRRELAEQAIARHVAEPLGVDVLRAARGIIEIVNANMTEAIRRVSIERGIDPRKFALLAGGGAGGLHAAALARMLGIGKVIVPQQAGTLCAFGMSVTDVRHDHTRPFPGISSQIDAAAVGRVLDELRDEARERLEQEGFGGEAIELEVAVDARYPGQVHELTIPVSVSQIADETGIRRLEATFHAEHRRLFSYALERQPVEFLHWRVTGLGKTGRLTPASEVSPVAEMNGAAIAAEPIGRREAAFDGPPVAVDVYAVDRVPADATIDGPAILQADDTAVVIGMGDVARREPGGSLVIEIAAVPDHRPDPDTAERVA